MSCGFATAQTFTTLRTFGDLTNATGRHPSSQLVQDADGTLYGATESGTVFKLQTDGSGFSALKWFPNSLRGYVLPVSLTLVGSRLYGIENRGGGEWMAFRLNTDGTGFTVLKRSTGLDDGTFPYWELTVAGNTLYGTTTKGGSLGYGTVFKLSTNGTDFTVLKNFSGSDDGRYPQGSLLIIGNSLYGTTAMGGSSDVGTLFKLSTDGTGFTVLKSFSDNNEGAYPYGGLTVAGNILYGTTMQGGSSNAGTVFKLNTNGSGFTVLKDFSDSDGANPVGGLTLAGNTLYGTTTQGGNSNAGTVFSLTTDGTGFAVLKKFSGSDGEYPQARLTLAGNTLYGTTDSGGNSNVGTIFKLNTDGSDFTVLKNLRENLDGSYPNGGLALAGNTLYGVTEDGGSSYVGTLFKVNTDGSGYTMLKDFDGIDGRRPSAGLTLVGDILYGITRDGGDWYAGTVFKVNTAGTDFTIIKTFTSGDGAHPCAELTLTGSTLYGTTRDGGQLGQGTVFRLNTDGTDFTVLKDFGGIDGSHPYGGLILASNTLYGTTYDGGSSNLGTVFKLDTDGNNYTVLKNFSGGDGAFPFARLTLAGDTLYGASSDSGYAYSGTVFKLNTDGTGFKVINWFTNFHSDGISPVGGLTLVSNTLYGTTWNGPSTNVGTIFKVNTDGTGSAVLKTFYVGGSDGAHPSGALVLAGNTLYGTAAEGGSCEAGTVFSLTLFSQPQDFSAHLINNNQLALQFIGTPNYPYVLVATTNLVSPVIWQPVITNSTDNGGLWQFTDTNVNSRQKFYRARGQ